MNTGTKIALGIGLFTAGLFYSLRTTLPIVLVYEEKERTPEQKRFVLDKLRQIVETRAQELAAFSPLTRQMTYMPDGSIRTQNKLIAAFQTAWNQYYNTELILLGPPPPRSPYAYERTLRTDGSWDKDTKTVFEHVTDSLAPPITIISGFG